VNYRRSIVEDKVVCGAVAKIFNKKMTGTFDVDSGRERFFIRVVLTGLTKNFFREIPCVKFNAV
jgi:hypothetical protein